MHSPSHRLAKGRAAAVLVAAHVGACAVAVQEGVATERATRRRLASRDKRHRILLLVILLQLNEGVLDLHRDAADAVETLEKPLRAATPQSLSRRLVPRRGGTALAVAARVGTLLAGAEEVAAELAVRHGLAPRPQGERDGILLKLYERVLDLHRVAAAAAEAVAAHLRAAARRIVCGRGAAVLVAARDGAGVAEPTTVVAGDRASGHSLAPRPQGERHGVLLLALLQELYERVLDLHRVAAAAAHVLHGIAPRSRGLPVAGASCHIVIEVRVRRVDAAGRRALRAVCLRCEAHLPFALGPRRRHLRAQAADGNAHPEISLWVFARALHLVA
mmetsp:Transcript_26764/g.71230  ORF Transcript_26764/g.71230 Transcript_26764/m.71230 type:complete len:332 (+) Transcript_26764:1417-2412(+)